MAEELGKIEKPPAEDFKKGRKLYFIPLIYRVEDSPAEYRQLSAKYWEQVERQIKELEGKLGSIQRIFHELIPVTGETALKAIEEISDKSSQIIRDCVEKGAQLEPVEDSDALTEFMDWGKCLVIGLQNPNVISKVYESYLAVGKKRTEYITRKIDETLKEDEIGILIMRENHQIQFPPDIQIFYVAPPALDEINRWLRDREARTEESTDTGEDKSAD
jgi:hypothetical protein